jgi:hypothetical protein
MIRRIMEEIKQEDEQEVPSRGRPTTKEADVRKIKINKAPIDQRPDLKLKNKVNDYN